MKPGATPVERFNAWFAAAIDKLRELPDGDGAFAALLIALPLYERGIIAKLKLGGHSTSEDDIRREIGLDLNLKESDRRIFWDMFRNGFMHQAMAKAGRTQWLLSHRFGELPEFRTVHGQSCVCIDPWKFTDRVIRSFQEDPRIIVASESFPLADVFSVQSRIVHGT